MGVIKFHSLGDQKEYIACYESHPALKIGDNVVYGGSCGFPKIKDAQVYVALQAGSSSRLASDPWDDQKVIEVAYPIEDRHAPLNAQRFKKMISWLVQLIAQGKKVHVGCVGGHGRTGLVLSALVAEATGEVDAIQYVRANYCSKAVESKEQVDFLIQHFGCSVVKPTKHDVDTSKISKDYAKYFLPADDFGQKSAVVPTGCPRIIPMHSPRCLWTK